MVKVVSFKTFSLPTGEFRALPVPGFESEDEGGVKLASCFVPCEALPGDLDEWMAVNPRTPEFDRAGRLKSRVAQAMLGTLRDYPERFSLMNQGIWVTANEARFEKVKGGQGAVTITLTDRKRHGIANGGHSYYAIRQVANEREANGETSYWGAFVRLHIITGVTADELEVSELALGLNRSIQVDAASIENLAGEFEPIKAALRGKPGEIQISYRQGDTGPVDIEMVLTLMNLFDVEKYPDWTKYPNALFGHSKLVLDNFTQQSCTSFDIITSKVHEILALSELVMEAVAVHLGKVKVSDADTAKRLGNPKSKRPGYFTDATVPKHFPVGWLYPMVGAFRANVDRKAWKKGKFAWLVSPEKIVPDVAEQLARVVYQEHKDNKHKPAEVGRKEAAYRSCYMTVVMALASRGVPTT